MKKNIFILQFLFMACVLFQNCKKVEADMRSYSFTVSRNNSPLASSSVSIETRNQNYTVTTDNDGKCKIDIPNSINLPSYTIVTIDHSSIKPYCLSVSGASNANSNLPINCTDVPTIVRLRQVDLYHLGNDQYSGSANSQLQLPSEGLEKSFSYSLPATPGIMPRIQIYARGIQHSVKIFCNGVATGSLANSPLSGDLSLYDFQLSGNANTIFRGGNNIITIKTGATGLSNDPWDDIEFCGLLLYYP
jgi:hypothetical protein